MFQRQFVKPMIRERDELGDVRPHSAKLIYYPLFIYEFIPGTDKQGWFPFLPNRFNEYSPYDGKIIQVLLSEIIETGEYTLEGVATYTRIPLDIIVDVACGTANQLSITPWTRIVDLYMQVRPTVSKAFFDKLVETMDKHNFNISSLLSET